jgi:hypothetical protein
VTSRSVASVRPWCPQTCSRDRAHSHAPSFRSAPHFGRAGTIFFMAATPGPSSDFLRARRSIDRSPARRDTPDHP